jgi:hypothetical protein
VDFTTLIGKFLDWATSNLSPVGVILLAVSALLLWLRREDRQYIERLEARIETLQERLLQENKQHGDVTLDMTKDYVLVSQDIVRSLDALATGLQKQVILPKRPLPPRRP